MIWLSSNNKKKQNKNRDKRIRARSKYKENVCTHKQIKRSYAIFVPFYRRSTRIAKESSEYAAHFVEV